MAIYITGDLHGQEWVIDNFTRTCKTTREDILILLGDACFNFYADKRDHDLKEKAAQFPITIFAVHGNHEIRPENIPTYREISWKGGTAYAEEEFPNLIFARCGEIYDLNGIRTMPIGGAHSIDKNSRIEHRREDGWCGWWEDEEPTDEIRARVEARLEKEDWKIDAILSHTCPTQLFKELNKMNTFTDFSILIKIRHGVHRTEEWLETIEQRLVYKKWYFGHYHKSRGFDRFVCLYTDILEFTTDPESGYPYHWKEAGKFVFFS